MLQQQTIKEPVAYAGIGLHSGNRVNMTFLPAGVNHGIRFRRIDLEGRPEIEAIIDHVSDTNRSTTLSKGNVKIHTVEHVLAALTGCGVDNAIVELDSNEPPIADGSASVYCDLIQKSGIVAQPEARELLTIDAPVELNLGESVMSVFPYDRFKITCTSSDRGGRFTQFYSLEISPEAWLGELARARTFCFYEEIEYLIKNGLIKGGSLENAVVIRDDAVLTNEPLRYENEFVRHKILDILGDLSLVGKPIKGHVIAARPSHAANCELARLIVQQARKPKVALGAFLPPPEPKVHHAEAIPQTPVVDGATLDVNQIMKILPHRYPFLMLDKVTKIDGNKIVGLKNVTVNEPFFEGHFPGHPIMPGVLQLEAIAQVGGILMLRQVENLGKLAYFMAAESVKWRKPVRPGDSLSIEVELTKVRGKICKAKGACYVDGELVSEADVTFMITDR